MACELHKFARVVVCEWIVGGDGLMIERLSVTEPNYISLLV